MPDAPRERPAPRRVGGRRVVLPAVAGTDATPQASGEVTPAQEDDERLWGDRPGDSNDDRLKRDVPPHWG